MKIRKKLFLIITGFVAVITICFLYTLYQIERNTFEASIDRELYSSAMLAKDLLPQNYHDNILNSKSVSDSLYFGIVNRFNKLCVNAGLEYVWSLMVLSDTIVFTSATSPGKDAVKQDHAKFFEVHSNPELYYKTFQTMLPQYQINADKWGAIKVVLLPFYDSHGRKYLVGAGKSIQFIQSELTATLLFSLLSGIILLAVGGVISFLISRSIAQPIEELSKFAERISQNDHSVPVKIKGTYELELLGSTVNMMSESIEKRVQEIEESEKRYRDITENMVDLIAHLDMQFLFRYISPSYNKTLGFIPSDLIGTYAPDLIHPEEKEATLSKIIKMLETGEGMVTIRNRHKNGNYLWFESTGKYLLDDEGNKAGALLGSRNITEKKFLEAELIMHANLLNSATDTIFLLEENGTILYTNEAIVHSHGYMKEEVLRQNIRMLNSEESANHVSDRIQKIFDGKSVTFEVTAKKKNGEIVPLEVHARSITIDGRKLILSSNRDISERIKAQLSIRQSEEQLRQSQKFESIGTLAGGIAHDFNNILNIILGNATLIAKNTDDQTKFIRRIDAILKAAERGANVVNQLLTFARKTGTHRQVVQINDLIKEIVKLLEETLPKSISLIPLLEPEIPEIIIDPNQFHQVMLNLCVNAKDAMPDGGTIKIETSIFDGKKLKLQYPAAKDDQYISISVRDTGSGMDEKTIQRIFDPFYTTKSIGKGTGLGLSVSHGIIESHDGFIEVRSTLSKGSEFILYLPVVNFERKVRSIGTIG